MVFRTNEDWRAQSQLSENLVRATLSTFYRLGIVKVQTVGKGKNKTPNKFRLNVERFKDWEQYSLEDCIKHPGLRIETDGYKAMRWQASYLTQQDKNLLAILSSFQYHHPNLNNVRTIWRIQIIKKINSLKGLSRLKLSLINLKSIKARGRSNG